ncbi:MAG: hypothetical protein KME07_22400 [Pegethrix bostrychoides GSE-TBD4-15B]|jgi:hypothetical protein|uniref:Uncharacterized protein n=1 Tax=Pegethrix bostrychoides GSE-TBD4-15B TaxID=2839662 RepID=A0A951PEG5_9CYAN|nr:hypothetical protein [Pegethrix bostrychoides GSE-TBD4-15B]
MANSIFGNQGSLDLRIDPFEQPVRLSWSIGRTAPEDFSVQIAPILETGTAEPYFIISVEDGEVSSKVFWPVWKDFIGSLDEGTNEIDPIALIRSLMPVAI